jgi:ribonucleoside-diphosphate reductase beta chain
MTEFLLTEEKDRFTIYPIRHPQIWEAYNTQLAHMWFPREVDMSSDLKDWNNLSHDERYFLKKVLGFFASSDLIVGENLAERFSREVMPLEAKFVYDFQKAMENIHSEAYAIQINTYITNLEERTQLFNSVRDDPIIAKKAAWTRRWIYGDRPFAERIVAFTAVEGIFFSGSFCAIYWIRERGLLPGLCKYNDLIAPDEGYHTGFGVLIHSLLINKCSREILHAIIKEAVELETEFITEAIPCRLIGMNASLMTKYIEYVGNRLVLQFGYEPLFPDSKNPFPFMERINLMGKSNFFEKKPTEYVMPGKEIVEAGDPYANL